MVAIQSFYHSIVRVCRQQRQQRQHFIDGWQKSRGRDQVWCSHPPEPIAGTIRKICCLVSRDATQMQRKHKETQAQDGSGSRPTRSTKKKSPPTWASFLGKSCPRESSGWPLHHVGVFSSSALNIKNSWLKFASYVTFCWLSIISPK